MENINYDIVIVGGGVAGLVAAKELLNAGKKVVIIEGRRRLGGRIKTLVHQFLQPVDAGAEFVHGDLPLTEELLKKAGSNTIKLKGKIYKKEDGVFKPVKNFIENYKEVFSELKGLQNDIPILEFLEHHFNEKENEATKQSVIKMVEGFDAADPARMSSFAVRDELQDGSMTESHFVKNGYVEIIKLLYNECVEMGCKIILSNTVKSNSLEKKHG